jgi:hypothetical protein
MTAFSFARTTLVFPTEGGLDINIFVNIAVQEAMETKWSIESSVHYRQLQSNQSIRRGWFGQHFLWNEEIMLLIACRRLGANIITLRILVL